jgi:hypothetical protein
VVGGDGVAGRKCFELLFIKLGLGGRNNGEIYDVQELIRRFPC